MEHKRLARSVIVEVALHVVSSLAVAALCLLLDRSPVALVFALVLLLVAGFMTRRFLPASLLLQIAAFAAFALAAALIGAIILPSDAGLARFSGLFLLAWLAGFVVPVAPSGLGVREAALLAMVGASLPAAPVLAATLALRAASIAGDLAYGFLALAQNRGD